MKPKVELVLFVICLSLAAVLRMGWPGITEFKRDEAHLYTLALDLAEFQSFPLRGIGSSVGIPNTPLSVYLFALPLFIWKSPLAATLFVGLLSTASVALAYLLVRRYWGPRAALFASFLYAVAPWAIIYSRKIWAQNLLPLFVVAYIFAALLALVDRHRHWLIVHLILLAVIVQIHLSGVSLVLVTAVLLLIFHRRVDWRMVGWGVLGALLTVVPYSIYLVMQGNKTSTGFIEFLNQPAQLSFNAIKLASLVSMGTEIHSLAGPTAFPEFLATVPNFDGLLYAGGCLALAGLVYILIRVVRGYFGYSPSSTRDEAGLIIALWLLIPVLFFLRHSTPVFPHYFILLLPAPFILTGIVLDATLNQLKGLNRSVVMRVGQFFVWGGVLILVLSQTWLTLALNNFLSSYHTPGGFGTPLRLQLQVVEAVRSLAPEDVVVVSEGADPDVDEIASVFDALLHGVQHRFVDGRSTAVLPADAAVIIWPGQSPFPGTTLYAEWGGQPKASIPLRTGEGTVQIMVGAGKVPSPPQPLDDIVLLGNGAELLGSGGDGVRPWPLWWRAPDGSEAENYTFFVHLLDANGGRVAQADLPTYPTAYWRADDLVVSYFPLDGTGATIRTGMYGAQSLAPVQVIDIAGNPAGEWIDFSGIRE